MISAKTDPLVTKGENNFNLLRLLAALGVIVTHSYALLGLPEKDALTKVTHGLLSFSRLGVYIFFIISGFLVAGSLERAKTVGSFFWKRFLRIFPGLIVVLFVTVFLLGPLATELPWREYFGRLGTYHYFFGGVTLYGLIYQLPGLFIHNPYPGAVNGSLWTLPYEWTCYVLLACLAPILKKRRWLIFFTLVLLSIFLRLLVGRYGVFQVVHILNLDTRQLMVFSSLFFLGALGLELRKFIPFNFYISFLLMVGIVLFSGAKVGFYWMLFALPYLTLWLAKITLPKTINRYFMNADFSYGFYIYAFPVGQLLAGSFSSYLTAASLAMFTAICTFPLAVCSWYFVEKLMLRFKT